MSYGAKKQIKESDPKMGFVGRPNKALAIMGLKDQNWSHFWERNRRERRRRRREEEEEERGDQAKIKRYGTWIFGYGNYLEYGFCMDHMNFKALYG